MPRQHFALFGTYPTSTTRYSHTIPGDGGRDLNEILLYKGMQAGRTPCGSVVDGLGAPPSCAALPS